MCIAIAFVYPLILVVESIPSCVIGGISIALFGFISVSGLRMIKDFDLNDSKNLFVVASIFITGIGGLFLKFGSVEISNIACALIVGILSNLVLSTRKKNKISQNPEMLESGKTIEKSKDIENKEKTKEKLDENENTQTEKTNQENDLGAKDTET